MVPLLRLDHEALCVLRNYFRRNPQERVHEARVHGLDPLADPDLYMTLELEEEPEFHANVALWAQRNRGVVTAPMIHQWIAEEGTEEGLV